jgi:hypothetical protein
MLCACFKVIISFILNKNKKNDIFTLKIIGTSGMQVQMIGVESDTKFVPVQ